jgi:hypothetical protein
MTFQQASDDTLLQGAKRVVAPVKPQGGEEIVSYDHFVVLPYLRKARSENVTLGAWNLLIGVGECVGRELERWRLKTPADAIQCSKQTKQTYCLTLPP